MQVNVFISAVNQDGASPTIVVLPAGPQAAIPRHLQHLEWRYFATVESGDKITGAPAVEVETALARDGYLVVSTDDESRN
jgi:hypothetical protein